MAEPLTVAIDVALRADIPLNGEVAIWGAGPIGIMACKIAKLRGAGACFSSARCATTCAIGFDLSYARRLARMSPSAGTKTRSTSTRSISRNCNYARHMQLLITISRSHLICWLGVWSTRID